MHLRTEIYIRAKQSADMQPNPADKVITFAQTVLLTTAENICNSSLGGVLNDFTRRSGTDPIRVFNNSSGNLLFRVLYCMFCCFIKFYS